MSQGLVCTLSFESIIRLQDAIAEWHASTPDKYRLCDNYLDVACCKEAIQTTADTTLLLAFMHFQVISTIIYSSLLRPVALKAKSDQLLSFIQNHTLEKALDGCRLLILAVRRVSQLERSETGTCYYMTSLILF